MNDCSNLLNDALDGFGDEPETTRFWLREIAVVAGVTLLLALDIGALGCEGGLPMLEHVALHLWGPGY